MRFQYSPFAIPLFIVAALSLALTEFARHRRADPRARVFGWMCAALAWWSLAYGLSMSGADLATQFLFNRWKYIGVMVVPPLWFLLAIEYTGARPSLSRRDLLAIWLPPLLLLPIVLTDHLTGLWWPDKWLDTFAGRPVLGHTHGLPYYLHLGISYLYIVWGLVLYVRFYRRAPRIYRSQTWLMIVGAAMPLVANLITQFGWSPVPWALDSFFFTLSSILMAAAILRYRFLDIIPVARQTVIEQISQGMIVVDTQGRVVDANPAARNLIQTGTGVIGQTLVDAVRRPALRQALAELIVAGRKTWMQDLILDDGTSPNVLSLTTTPLSYSSGVPMGQIILIQDISERMAAQRELQALYRQAETERARLSSIMHNASDMILLLDHEGRILAANPSAHAVLHLEDSPLPAAIQEIIAQARREDRAVRADVELGEQAFGLTAAPAPGTGLVLTMHDVTQLKQLARLKDEFVATVSHDLRSPLTTVLGYADIARADDLSAEQRRDMLDRIISSAWHMVNLINDLLDLATLEAGGAGETEAVSPGQVARDVAAQMEKTARIKGLTLECDVDETAQIEADRRLIAQLVRNLVDNAIKYTPHGTVTVHTHCEADRVVGRVTDTGIGIPASDLPHVFRKFYRGKHPAIRDISGTGLGLSLVKSIVDRYGGQIWVESKPGAGTAVTFTLPRRHDNVPPPLEQIERAM